MIRVFLSAVLAAVLAAGAPVLAQGYTPHGACPAHQWNGAYGSQTVAGDCANPATSDLSDVSSGTWTPADASGAGLTLTSTDTTWYRIGAICVVTFHIQWPSTASSAQAEVSGIPSACSAMSTTSNWVAGGSPALSGVTLDEPVMIALQTGLTSLWFFTYGTSGITNATLSGAVVAGTLVYRHS